MRKLYLIAGLAVVVVLGLLAAIPAMLSSDSLRWRFAEQLSAITGSTITLNGPVRFSIVPDFGIVAEDLAISTPAGDVAVSVKRAVAGVQLGTLLSDQIRITRIELEQPEITLHAGSEAVPSAETAGRSDVFQAAADVLERLSIDRIGITGGTVRQAGEGGIADIAGDIEMTMAIPGVDRQSSITFAANLDGTAVTADVSVASLSLLLAGQPTAFSMSSKTSPSPHPALEALAAKGTIQLAGDGSYRIENSLVTTLDQPMRLDAVYRPGARAAVDVTMTAKTLEFADFEEPETAAPEQQEASVAGSGPDLSALAGFDTNVELNVDTFAVGGVRASGVKLVAVLINGLLDSTLSAENIAGGTISNRLLADVSQPAPEFQGAVRMRSVRLEDLATFVGARIPATGEIGSELEYAFRGASGPTIKKTINLAGKLTLGNGEIRIPALADVAGQGAQSISAVNATATFSDIESPVAIEGSMMWNGERVDATAEVSPLEFLTGNRIAAAISIKAAPLEGGFNGAIEPDGKVKGTARLTTSSLSRLLAWFDQDPGTPLGRFSYAGAVSLSDGTVAFEKARLSLDGMTGGGSATIRTAPRTTIDANLVFDELDLASLTGGGNGQAENGQDSDTPIDLSMLRTFDAEIALQAGKLGYGEVFAGPAQTSLSVRDGVAQLTLPPAGFYGGAVELKVTADGSADLPAIDLDMKMEGVDALPLLDGAADFTRVEGKLNAVVSAKGAGGTTRKLARSLDGNAAFVFTDGALRGIDIAWIFSNMRLLFATGYQEDPSHRTEFTELSVSMDIKDGVATTDDIKLLGPLVRMDGSGQVDLADQTIEMLLNPKLVGSLEGQGGAFDVSGLGMPVIVTGPLSGPKIYPDLTRLLADPDTAFKNLDRLQDGLEALGQGKLDAAGIVKDQLGAGASGGGDIVSGLVERLAGGGDGRTGAGDVVGSVISGLTGQSTQAPDDQSQAGNQPEDYPIVDVPVPTPDPRRQAAQVPAAETPAAETPKTATDQVVDQIIPQIVPEEQSDSAGSLVKGLLNSLGRE